jgi:pilus assembly protein Flp/PilA
VEDSRGSTAIEYALLASLIALAIIASVTQLGSAVLALFNRIQF